MFFIEFSENNEIVARYLEGVHDPEMTRAAVRVPEELFFKTINENDGVWKRDPETGEITKHPLPPTLPTAELARAKRDHLINSFIWRINRHRDELDLGLEPTEPLEPLLQHVQLLRDVPQQAGFPKEVVWPTEPELPR